MTESHHYAGVLSDLREPTRSLNKVIPEAWSGFAKLHAAAFEDGAMPRKTKELIALSIAIVKRCDGCIASHARGAARLGATPEEVAETIAVTIAMEGGPATVYGPRAWEAYLEFSPSDASSAPTAPTAVAPPSA